MRFIKSLCLAMLIGSLIATSPAWARDDRSNFAYVQSIETGVFYARCIPAESEGTKGHTQIYSVSRDKDRLVDSYDWYTRAVILGWSPIAGKVAVMALGGTPSSDSNKQVEFSFYLGGKFLHSYTAEDLINWGANSWRSSEGRMDFKVIGAEQIPGTNEYVFSIEIKGKKLSFDILTGKPYTSTKAD